MAAKWFNSLDTNSNYDDYFKGGRLIIPPFHTPILNFKSVNERQHDNSHILRIES